MFEGLFQPMHIILIAGLALLIFGPKKLPELGKGIGEGIRGFKASMNPDAVKTEQPKEENRVVVESRPPAAALETVPNSASKAV
jgi:sec-independent protein translocase protein TatA